MPEEAKAFFDANYPKLNDDQKHVFDYIKDLILRGNGDGTLAFLDAPGGTGKMFTLNVLVSWIVMEGREVATTATSGIAATPCCTLDGQLTTGSSSFSIHKKTHSATSRNSRTWQSSCPKLI